MQKKSLKTPAIWMSAISVLVLIGLLFFRSYIEVTKFVETVIYPLVEMLCSITITAAIGTYLIEWKGFVDYIQQKLSEILSKPDMVNNLDATYQIELLSHLIYRQTAINNPSFNMFMEKFYAELKKQADEFGFYLLEQSNRVKCSIYKENGSDVIDPDGMKYRKLAHNRTITYGFLIEPPVYLTEILSVNVIDEKLFNGKKCVQISYIKVNGKKLNDKEYSLSCYDNQETKRIDTLYKKKYICKLHNQIKIEEGLKIEISYATYEPFNDFSYCTRMKYFCKRFKMDFTYDTSHFNISAQSFTFGEKKGLTVDEDTISFDIDNWLMPGEGTNIYIGGK